MIEFGMNRKAIAKNVCTIHRRVAWRTPEAEIHRQARLWFLENHEGSILSKPMIETTFEMAFACLAPPWKASPWRISSRQYFLAQGHHLEPP